MSNNDPNKPRTGLWKKDGDPTYYGGKITVTVPGEYWVNIYKNDRKETESQPDLNLQLKLKDGATGNTTPRQAPPPPDDDFDFR